MINYCIINDTHVITKNNAAVERRTASWFTWALIASLFVSQVDLRCEHNTYPKTVAKKTKNTSCCATMYLVLKRKIHSKNRASR